MSLSFFQYEKKNTFIIPNLKLATINHQAGSAISRSNLELLCFGSNYVIAMLAKFGLTSFNNINIQYDIDGNTIGWTLGYLVEQVNNDNFLPNESPNRALPTEFFIPAIIIASVFAVLTLIAILVCIFCD